MIHEDDDESFDAGDRPIEDINWYEVEHVQALFDAAADPSHPMTARDALTDIYGDDLMVP